MNNKAIIGIGSNLGNKKGNIERSIELLEKECKIEKKSALYITEPEGFYDQPRFLNAVIKINTNKTPKQLLSSLQKIERKLKKNKKFENGPRTIDLDILTFKEEIITKKDLIIPHPRMHKRLFVLMPLKEIEPNFIHPILKKKVDELIKEAICKEVKT